MQTDVPTGWRQARIADFAWEVSQRARGSEEVLSVTKNRGFVPSLEYFGKQIFSKEVDNYKVVKRGQFAYATIHLDEGSIDCLRVRDEGIISPMYTVFDIDPQKVDRRFLLELLKTPAMLSRYSGIGQGSINRRKSVGFDSLGGEPIPLPPLPEQKKIAEILGSVDEAIRATEAVIEQTRRVKEGLLQELLTKGIGHTKFKQTEIGEIPEGWEVVPLGELTLKIVDGVHKKPDYVDSGVPFVTVKNLTAGGSIDLSDTKFITPQDHQLFSKRTDPQPGDVLVTKDGTLGVARVVPHGLPEFNIFGRVAQLRPVVARIEPQLIRAFFDSHLFPLQLSGLSAGSGLKHIHLSHFRQFLLPVPPKAEQQLIVRRLTEVARVEEQQGVALKQLSVLKAGLLQDLLTGKVRVKP